MDFDKLSFTVKKEFPDYLRLYVATIHNISDTIIANFHQELQDINTTLKNCIKYQLKDNYRYNKYLFRKKYDLVLRYPTGKHSSYNLQLFQRPTTSLAMIQINKEGYIVFMKQITEPILPDITRSQDDSIHIHLYVDDTKVDLSKGSFVHRADTNTNILANKHYHDSSRGTSQQPTGGKTYRDTNRGSLTPHYIRPISEVTNDPTNAADWLLSKGKTRAIMQ